MRLNEKQWEQEAGGSAEENHSEGVYSVRLDALQVFLNQYRDARKSPKEPSGGSEEPAGCFSQSRSLIGL